MNMEETPMWPRRHPWLPLLASAAIGCSCEQTPSGDGRPDTAPPSGESDHSGTLDSDTGSAPLVDAHELLGRGLVALPRDGGVFLS